MKLIPQGARGWRWFCLRWCIILVLLGTGLIYTIDMPGKSDSGPFQPFNEDEHELRNRMERHITHLALQIGERNVWRYAELEAAAAYIHDSFSKLGLVPSHSP